MRYNLRKDLKKKPRYIAGKELLAAVYPRIYCPRCGSKDIGLLMFSGNDAIWECRECDVNFRLIFPTQSRF
jgi:ribosomal protein L37AE/L43A